MKLCLKHHKICSSASALDRLDPALGRFLQAGLRHAQVSTTAGAACGCKGRKRIKKNVYFFLILQIIDLGNSLLRC